MKRATAVAHANIALVKYWGKLDDERILPGCRRSWHLRRRLRWRVAARSRYDG